MKTQSATTHELRLQRIFFWRRRACVSPVVFFAVLSPVAILALALPFNARRIVVSYDDRSNRCVVAAAQRRAARVREERCCSFPALLLVSYEPLALSQLRLGSLFTRQRRPFRGSQRFYSTYVWAPPQRGHGRAEHRLAKVVRRRALGSPLRRCPCAELSLIASWTNMVLALPATLICHDRKSPPTKSGYE